MSAFSGDDELISTCTPCRRGRRNRPGSGRIPPSPRRRSRALAAPRNSWRPCGYPGLPQAPRRGATLAVPTGAHAVPWRDSLIIEPTPQFPIAVDPEWPLPRSGRSFRQAVGGAPAPRRVLFPATEPVTSQLQGGPGPDRSWTDGAAHDAGPPGEPRPGTVGHLGARPFTAVDAAVARQATSRATQLQVDKAQPPPVARWYPTGAKR